MKKDMMPFYCLLVVALGFVLALSLPGIAIAVWEILHGH